MQNVDVYDWEDQKWTWVKYVEDCNYEKKYDGDDDDANDGDDDDEVDDVDDARLAGGVVAKSGAGSQFGSAPAVAT